MKVILLQDVSKVGKKGQIVNVADGYGVNSLLPSKKAVIATPEAIRRHEIAEKEKAAINATARQKNVDALKTIDGKELMVSEKANDKGGLFSKIHEAEIVKYILEQTGLEASQSWLKDFKTITQVGEHPIKLVYEDASITLNLRVVKK